MFVSLEKVIVSVNSVDVDDGLDFVVIIEGNVFVDINFDVLNSAVPDEFRVECIIVGVVTTTVLPELVEVVCSAFKVVEDGFAEVEAVLKVGNVSEGLPDGEVMVSLSWVVKDADLVGIISVKLETV